MTKYALEIEHLNKTYRNGVIALKDINLNVEDGDIFAFLGPNGAGKSTVIGIITTLVNITSGRVKVYGKDIMEHPETTKQMIGVVPQEYNLNQFIPIIETMINIGGYFGLSKKQALSKSQELFEDLGIWDKRESTPRELSGGMKRRLMIARALIHDPKLLILDEPTAGVDTELRLTMWDFFKKINNDGVTIILTTHYLEEAEELCDRITILNNGKVIKDDTKNNLLKIISNKTVLFQINSEISLPSELNNYNPKIENGNLKITYDKNTTSLNEIINILNKNKISFQEINTFESDLEDIFLKLVKGV